MATSTREKVRENRLRRMAERQGFALRKAARRDPRALDYGHYWLIDPYNSNAVVAGDQWGWDLDDIETYLLADPDDRFAAFKERDER